MNERKKKERKREREKERKKSGDLNPQPYGCEYYALNYGSSSYCVNVLHN